MKLTADQLSFAYKNSTPLWKDVSLSVQSGQIFSLLGANGAGKSTLLRCLIGFFRPLSGTVTLETKEGTYSSIHDAREFTARIGYVPQLQNIAYSFLTEDYVVMGRAPHLGLLQHPSKADYEMAEEIMADLGIYDVRRRPFNTLSGGQQRQAVIARAIIQQPDMIIMDEPTNHLDYGNQFRILEMIEKLADKGMAVLLTTHMPDQALYLGGEAGILYDRTLHVGRAETVITESALEKVYQVKIRLVHLDEVNRTVCIAE